MCWLPGQRRTRTHTAAQPPHKQHFYCVDWPCLTSRTWERCLQETGRSHFGRSHPAEQRRWQIPNAALLLKGAARFNGSREDWKWHSINRNCQTIKQSKQHRWDTDESGCQKTFTELESEGWEFHGPHLWSHLVKLLCQIFGGRLESKRLEKKTCHFMKKEVVHLHSLHLFSFCKFFRTKFLFIFSH